MKLVTNDDQLKRSQDLLPILEESLMQLRNDWMLKASEFGDADYSYREYLRSKRAEMKKIRVDMTVLENKILEVRTNISKIQADTAAKLAEKNTSTDTATVG